MFELDGVKFTFRGWGGHFCLASRCLFRLNTLIEFEDIKVVVSTVGNMVMPGTNKTEEIGCDRYMETMAFFACLEGGYFEADVSKQVTFEFDWHYEKPGMDNEATEGHWRVCLEIADKLRSGKLVKPNEAVE